MSIRNILDDCGLKDLRFQRIQGGDINQSYCLFGQDQKYFLKVNDELRFPGMFGREAEGLDSLRDTSTLIIPKVAGMVLLTDSNGCYWSGLKGRQRVKQPGKCSVMNWP